MDANAAEFAWEVAPPSFTVSSSHQYLNFVKKMILNK
jgi:hypothetical protein